MSLVKLTVSQIRNLGLWEKVCEFKGYDEWMLNEGRISENDYIEFEDEFKKEEIKEEKLFKFKCPECSEDNASIYRESIQCNNCGFVEKY